jgi:cellulose synthase operon protein C
LGRAQAKAGKSAEALLTLRKALTVAGSEAAVRAELYTIIGEVYRKEQKLPELIALLEKERNSDLPRQILLGSLYEETGDVAKALALYKQALAQNPRHLDLRLKAVRLLQSQGEIDKAIAEYEALVRAAPNNPTFVFELCDALLQRGDRARALRILTEVEGRVQNDDEALSRIADFYGRIGENDRSVKVLEQLARMGNADPGHITDLGDRYYQNGDKPMAVQTWKRILTAVTPRAKALATIAEVYLEHEMGDLALAAFREAVALEPQSLVYKRQYAMALEHERSLLAARNLWQEIMAKASAAGDRPLVREARSRIVSSWSQDKTLAEQLPRLQAAFRGPPPDAESGRMLGEALTFLRKYAESEKVWREIVVQAPGDVDAYLALERVLVQQNKTAEAIPVVERLVQVDPKRARELYQRLAQYALSLYRDDDAIRFAAKAVELNPDDAEGHRRLGDMYRSRQQTDKAVVEYKAAIARRSRAPTPPCSAYLSRRRTRGARSTCEPTNSRG